MTALSFSYSALEAATRRLTHVEGGIPRPRAVWAAAAEATWWVGVIDDRLVEQFDRGVYKAARQDDRQGVVVDGLLWLRNRHAHEVAVSGSGSQARDYYNPGPDAVVFISETYLWLPIDRIAAEREEARSRALRPFYEKHVGGQPIDTTLYSALRWFARVIEASGFASPLGVTGEDPDEIGR